MASKPFPTVAFITNDVVGERMAGPGIRYWEFARALGQHVPVELIVPPSVPMESVPAAKGEPFSLHVCKSVQELRGLLKDCTVIVTQGLVLPLYPFLAKLGKPLVVDIYDPFHLAVLQREMEGETLKRVTVYEKSLNALRFQLLRGDFFLCASEKQRDYWLGMLSTMGRANPCTYGQDPTLRRLIDVVPFGLPKEPPRHTRNVLKGSYKTIAADDKVILWGGGIWNWFDAPTLIRAMPHILQQRNDVKLFFMGIRRPNASVAKMEAVEQAIALSKELGLYDKHVFFNDWVPYDERQNYLLEADIGASLHLDYIETRFAFRTRLLDYLWAGLPVVATGGEALGEAMAAQGVAHLVAPSDVEEVARVILDLLDNPTLRADHAARSRQMAADYHWDVVTRPLVNFCASPYLAPDKEYLRQGRFSSDTSSSWPRLLIKSWRALRLGGVPEVLSQVQEYLRWKMQK